MVVPAEQQGAPKNEQQVAEDGSEETYLNDAPKKVRMRLAASSFEQAKEAYNRFGGVSKCCVEKPADRLICVLGEFFSDVAESLGKRRYRKQREQK